ncbi:MAG: penicillin-binding protein 1A [Thermodesulfovibrionales bacterium]|nr:penicillin-binding protein 1A [Thermodesulfovibrionales bacterium]
MAKLEDELKHAGKNKASRMRIFLVLLSVFSAIAGIVIGSIYWVMSELPQVKALEAYKPIESSHVYSSEGELLAELYLERRTLIPHYRIPEHIKKAFVSIEDIRFYRHHGVDVIGIMRALYHDVKAGSIVQGGSTITQQLAKMLFLKPDRSIKRKIKEAVISMQIEKRYTKDEILGLYLNQAYFGTRAYGIEAASQTYFKKSTDELNIAEAALLASLPKAPSLYSPFKNPERAKERRKKVLKEMLKNKFITEAQFKDADRFPLPVTPGLGKYNVPYFIEAIRQELENKYGDELYTSGYRIYSTLSSGMQKAAEDAVKRGLFSIGKRAGTGVEAALVAVDIKTGHVKAMVGGSDFWKNQFNRAVHALRQPGSAFKPFVYTAAIEKGMTSQEKIVDSPIFLKGSKPGEVWSPKNYDGNYYGNVTLKTALAQSLNAATVRLADKLGINNVIETAKRLGIKSELQPYASLAIGASDVTLIEMVSAYSVFASGKRVNPILHEKILGRDGRIVEETRPAAEYLLSEKTAEEMKILLRAVVEEGTAQSAKELKVPVYGKTGTTNNYTDAWFIGFDDRLVVGVWVGRDNHKPIGKKEAGSRAALPIWIEFMKKAPLQIPEEQNP